MEVTWKYIKPLKDRMAVRSFLQKYQVSLPEDLIEIMENNNGGRPSPKEIITNTNREYVFKSLLSYNNGDLEVIYNIYPDLFKGTTLYPIGFDSAGNIVCYALDSNDYVLYMHETGEKEQIKSLPWK